MLPTVAPEAMEKFSVIAALGEPIACKPKFKLGGVSLKNTCDRATVGSSKPARTTVSRKKCIFKEESLQEGIITDSII